MATFVQIEPDAFNKVFSDTSSEGKQSIGTGSTSLINNRRGQYHHVRRPVRGIQVKNDTYATLQVRKSNGVSLQLFDAASASNTGKGFKNSNFLIQSVTEQRAEKQQIILTFGEPYIFFFGEQPRTITVSGILINTEDFNWRAEWWENYDKFLRGTQCVRTQSRIYLSWDDIIVEGYITQASAVEDSSNSNLVQFNFQVFITNYQNISNIGDPKGHLQGKEISLDPSTIDLPGQGGLSSTAQVRAANLQQQLSQNQGADSLYSFLRNGPASTALPTSLDISGQKVDFLSVASRFISGRNIRVPIGFTGAAAFDQEVQLALSSVPGSEQVINGSGADRTISFQTSVNGLVTEFKAQLNSKFGPAHYDNLSANYDEFVARIPQDANGDLKFNNLFNNQLADDNKAEQKVADTLSKFGAETPNFDSVTNLVKTSTFGVVSLRNAISGTPLRTFI